jgi:beta-glucosidase
VPWSHLPYSVNQSPQHDALARRAADESIVLLKNDGVLPLSANVRRIAVIGPTADDIAPLLGNYHGTPKAPVTILQGIRQAAPHAEVTYARGAELVEGFHDPNPANREKALEAARNADVVIFVGGLTADLEGEEMKVNYPGLAGGDRTDLRLPATQQTLLEALQATGKPVVLVLTTGSALAIDWARQHVPAILVAWYPGQDGGTAVADALFGHTDPAGRLPITFYKADEKLPAFDDYHMEGRTYRYFKGEPLYPFGHGLSYTHFAYSDLQLDRSKVRSGDHIKIALKVKNTGERAGDEVVQLYLQPLHAPHARVNKELRGFQRLHLQAGEEQTVTFDISPATDLTYYDDVHHAYAVDAGSYRVQIGASSADIRLAEDFMVER